MRCAFTVVPKELLARTAQGGQASLHPLWNRRMTTAFNGVSYITQRGAAALYSEEGQAQVQSLITHYMGNAALLREAVIAAGLTVYGGTNAPYLWVQSPLGEKSWETFDRMLHDHHIVVTPGSGFGSAGEGYFRISAFNSRDNVLEVAKRLSLR